MENLIKSVYKGWKNNQKLRAEHPDEETLNSFLEAKMSLAESEQIKAHLISCDKCSEVVAICLSKADEKSVPEDLLSRVKQKINSGFNESFVEIVLKLKGKTLEILNTGADILVGQEFVPAPVLRSRSIKEFKDEVFLLKDFKDIRVEIKIENKGGSNFSIVITVKQKNTQKVIKDLRITLMRDGLELESYISDSGSVTFSHVLLGKYIIEIHSIDAKLASIKLETKT